VPADPSSPIPPGLAPLCDADPLRPVQPADLLVYLAAIPDPRARAGRRHPLVAIVGLAAAAVLTGARSITAIAEWAAAAPQPVRAALGTRRDRLTGHFMVPTKTTIRRTLGRLDTQAMAAALGAWLCDRDRHDRRGQRRRRQAVAVDGTTLRGARPHQPPQQTATAAPCTCWPRPTTPPARWGPNRRSAARQRRSPPSSHCWRAWTWPAWWSPPTRWETHPAAEFLVTRTQAHSLVAVNANQPTLLGALRRPALAPRRGLGPHR
jgi:hypothetical protein